jgi:hypothetical protein
MAIVDDPPNEMRIALGDPAECEERRLGLIFFEHQQNPLDIPFDPAFTLHPTDRAGYRERAPRPGSSLRHRSSDTLVIGWPGISRRPSF